MFLEETKENIRKQFAVFTEKFERAGKEIEARIHAEPADEIGRASCRERV